MLFILVPRVISAFQMAGEWFAAKVGREMFVAEMIDDHSDSHDSHGLHGSHRGSRGSLARRFGRPTVPRFFSQISLINSAVMNRLFDIPSYFVEFFGNFKVFWLTVRFRGKTVRL